MAIVCCALVGLLAGAMSALLTGAVYAAEDAFKRLPIHWMWWPAIGGLAIGAGGLAFPQALGVGYDVIAGFLQTDMPARVIVGVLIVKSTIWAVSLGSGTSGGVLAPLLMIGGALGGLEARVLPWEGVGFWPLLSMGAVLGGTMRSPLTAVIFALELTHDVNVLLPLLLAVTVAHGFTVLTLRRSILTEKVSRRGYHLSCEYSIDPLEIVFVHEVMRTGPAVLLDATVPDDDAIVAYPDEPLRMIVFRMAETGVTELPVIGRGDRKLIGMIALADLLKARGRILDAEFRRERVLGTRLRRDRRERGERTAAGR
jgi:CBS domain-containing protein